MERVTVVVWAGLWVVGHRGRAALSAPAVAEGWLSGCRQVRTGTVDAVIGVFTMSTISCGRVIAIRLVRADPPPTTWAAHRVCCASGFFDQQAAQNTAGGPFEEVLRRSRRCGLGECGGEIRMDFRGG